VSRIALFGGIYSNHLALAEAIADARQRNIDACYCLGDLGAFGPHPDRIFPLLESAGVVTMAGNYDDSLAKGLDDCQCGYTDPRDNRFAQLSYDYTFRNTSGVNKSWMATLPVEIRLELDGKRVLLCHGSPRRQNEFLWESTTPDHFLEKIYDDHDADIVVTTHTGIKWSRELTSGRLFINCGVLGRPENDGTPRVWYAILETEPGASPRVEFVTVSYDWRALAREMRLEELPAEFIETIETGWWTTCLEILPAKERRRGCY
jgi:predicted phosphodiesterase